MGPNLRYVVEMIRRHGLAPRSKVVRNWLRLIEQGLIRDSLAPALLVQMQPLIIMQERRPNLLFRPPDDASELYPEIHPPLAIGHLLENEDIPLSLSPRGAFHFVAVGSTNSGKTFAIRAIVNAIEKLNRKRDKPLVVIIFDYKGVGFADFPGQFGDHWRHYDSHGALRLGLQAPLGVPTSVWINHLCSSFCARSGLIFAWVTLANLMRWLVAEMNVQPSDQVLFPDFQLLLDAAYELPKKVFADQAKYLDSMTQILRGVTEASGELFRSFNGLDLERDLISHGHSAVIEVPNLSPDWLKNFVVDLYLLQLLVGRLARGHRVNDPEVLLIFDDCDAVVSRDSERQFPGGMSPIMAGLRQFRELGVGVGLGFGALSPVSPQLLNSISHHFIFRNSHDDCADSARRTLGLPARSQTLIQALTPGEAVVRLPGPWSHAFLAKIDEVPRVPSGHNSYEANSHVASRRLSEMPELLGAIKKLSGEHLRGEARRALSQHGQLRSKARELLTAAANHPFYPVVQLYKLIGAPSAEMQKAIRKQLQAGEFASIVDVRIGRRNVALIELRESAWSLLGKPPIELRGRGELPHRCYANWVAELGRKLGYESVVEWNVPGSSHPVDVAWMVSANQWHVFEVVVTCKDNLSDHLKSIFLTPGSPVTKATIVAPQKQLLAKLKTQVESYKDLDAYRKQIEFLSVEDVMKELWS